MALRDPFYVKYELDKRLGHGTFSSVYMARDRRSGLYVAAKFIDPTAQKYGSESQEVRILQSLEHDCVVRLTEAYEPYFPASPREAHERSQPGRERKQSVLVFPAFDMDLKMLMQLRRSCPEEFSERQRSPIARCIFSGLAYLHGKGILHRDIKPANIFVRFGRTMQAVIGDVGLGAMTSPSSAAGEAHTAHVCTDGYVAPELLVVRSNGFVEV